MNFLRFDCSAQCKCSSRPEFQALGNGPAEVKAAFAVLDNFEDEPQDDATRESVHLAGSVIMQELAEVQLRRKCLLRPPLSLGADPVLAVQPSTTTTSRRLRSFELYGCDRKPTGTQ